MSARTRVFTVVGLAAAVAVGGIVGATLVQSRHDKKAPPNSAVSKPLAGVPPLIFDFGVRSDPEARALDRAATLYNKKKATLFNQKKDRSAAGAIFARYHSLPAQIGAAFAAWPKNGLETLKALVASHSHSALAELHLGYAYLWSGRNADAVRAWQQAVKVEPDSPAAVSASGLLHPNLVPGLPFIVTELKPPARVATLPAAQELAALRRAAARPDPDGKILYGFALWNLSRPISAERQFRAAAALAPDDPMARTAAAVGAYSKERPVAAFSQLGPLTAAFPKAAVVRFHLGVLLLWSKELGKARAQLRLAIADNPNSAYGKAAMRLLSALGHNGTK